MRINVGYKKEIYEKTGLLIPATVRSEGSILLSGSTGSGKTTLLWYLLYSFIQSMGNNLVLEICDYKHEYTALYGCHRYHSEVVDIIGTIDRFFNSFEETKRGSQERDGKQHVLVIDEYMSFISYLEAMSKSNKSYKEQHLRTSMQITSLLAMGRAWGFSLILIVQQASAKSFASTADRENFINKIAMGSQSDISADMIFDAADTSGIDYKKAIPVGHGYLAVQGEPVISLIVPKMLNPDVLHRRIREFLESRGTVRPP